MKRQGISISSILFAHLSCFSLVPLFKRCDTVWCSEKRKKKKIVRMNYKSVISTSRLPYTFSLYQIICLLFERVWIESLYSFNVCYVFLSRLSFFVAFYLVLVLLLLLPYLTLLLNFSHFGTFAKDIYTILCIIEIVKRQRISRLLFDPSKYYISFHFLLFNEIILNVRLYFFDE